jgi:hypothetical protein
MIRADGSLRIASGVVCFKHRCSLHHKGEAQRHSVLSVSLNAMVRSTFPLEAKIRISPERKDARPCVVTDCLTLLREHPDDVSPAGETQEALNARRLASNRRTDPFSVSIVLQLSRQTCFGACRLFVSCVNAHHSLKSPVCSCVSESVPGRMADAARIL